jgi:hypothetical protein
MDNFQSSSRRADEQLEAMLHDVGLWAVNGRQGEVLCSAPSLARAMARAEQYAASGAVVIAICRLPGNSIIVFAEQMARLRRNIGVREMVHPVAA